MFFKKKNQKDIIEEKVKVSKENLVIDEENISVPIEDLEEVIFVLDDIKRETTFTEAYLNRKKLSKLMPELNLEEYSIRFESIDNPKRESEIFFNKYNQVPELKKNYHVSIPTTFNAVTFTKLNLRRENKHD